MQTGFNFKRIELLDHAVRAIGKLFIVVRSPPHHQISVGVETRAGIVKAVAHLVANHGADAAIVESVTSSRIIERWMQNPRRKIDLVELWIVVSINRRRRHPPLGAIDRLADLADVSPKLELSGRGGIRIISAAIYAQRFVVTPLVRITYLAHIRFEFGD